MRYQTENLTIESTKQRERLTVRWMGRSEDRDPSRALAPLLEAVDKDIASANAVDFDFRSLEYMNSSTIRPILHLVQSTSGRVESVRVYYDGTKSWQRLSFVAIGAVLGSLDNVELFA